MTEELGGLAADDSGTRTNTQAQEDVARGSVHLRRRSKPFYVARRLVLLSKELLERERVFPNLGGQQKSAFPASGDVFFGFK